MKATGPYQLLDPLSLEDYAALKADIAERGVLVALEFDEDGNVLDGHHRKMICEELGITDYPTVIRRGWTEEQKRTHARRMNLARRQLTRDQRRKLIEDELRESPGTSDNSIGKNLGVDHKTVGSVRSKLERVGEIPQLDSVTGSDGKQYARIPVKGSTGDKKAILDADGNEVPNNLVAVFRTAQDLASVANSIMDAKRRTVAVGKILDAVPDAKVRRLFDRLLAAIRESIPHAIHSDCGGAGCGDCHGLGYTTVGEIPQLDSEWLE